MVKTGSGLYLNLIIILGTGTSFLLGLMVLFGWYTNNSSLIQVSPEFVPMQYNTALCFVLSGLSAYSIFKRKNVIASMFAFVTICIAILTLSQYVLITDFGIDQFFMQHAITVKSFYPGRMAPETAFSFIIVSSSLILLNSGSLKHINMPLICGVLGSLLIGVSLVALSGYMLALDEAYGLGDLTQMAVHTSLGFVCLGIAITGLAWKESDMDVSYLPSWFPVILGVGGFVIVFSIWLALESHNKSLVIEYANYAHLNKLNDLFLVMGILLAILFSVLSYYVQVARNRQELFRVINNRLTTQIHERNVAVNELAESEERWSFALEGNKDGVWDWNLISNEIYFSFQFKEILGYQDDEIQNDFEEWDKRIHPDDKVETYEELDKYIDGAIPSFEIEHRLLCKDGSYKWVLDRGMVVSWADDNKPERMIGTISDITRRKLLEEESVILIHDKGERVKEITCMHAVTESIQSRLSLEEVFQDTVDSIPAGWHYPEFTRARITFDKIEYVSEVFDDTQWMQSSDIVVSNKVRGKIEVFYIKEFSELYEGPFLKEERELINSLSSKLGRAVDLKTTEEKLTKSRRLYVTLSQINQAIVRESDKNKLFQIISDIVIEYGEFKFVWFGLIDESTKQINPVAYSGNGTEYIKTIKLSLTDDLTKACPVVSSIINEKSTVLNDLENDPDFSPWRENALNKGYLSLASFPFSLKDEIIGAFNVYSESRNFFDDDEINLLEKAANDITFALEKIEDEKNRKLAEKKALHSGKLLNSVFQVIPDLFFLLDKDDFILEFRSGNSSDLYVKPDNFIGKRMQDVIPEPVASQFEEKLLLARDSGVLVAFEYELIIAQQPRYWEARISRLPNESQVIAIVRDITDSKKTADNIRAYSQHLKLYQEQTPLAAIEWNTDFQVIDWNAAAEEMFGYTLDEVKGRDFVDIMLPASAIIDVKKIWEDLISQTGGNKSINENLTKDGQIILCEWHNTPLRDESGKVIGAASLVLDVTSEHKSKQALLEKEREQREILNSMVDAVITIDENGCIETFNQTAETLFGYKFDEIKGKSINLLMPEIHSNKHDGYIKKYIATGNKKVIGLSREVEGVNKNKQIIPLRISVAELPVSVDGKHRFIGSCQDLTNIKQQEEKLRRTQKMDALGKLTGGIAHDYNNMLGVILGYSDLLKTMLVDQPKLADYASQINYAGKRGAKLTKKLLSFSRKGNPEATKLSINTILLEQQDMLEKTLTVRIKLLFNLADDVWPIYLDHNDLEDAILNMSINAMHAMQDKTSAASLTITTQNASLNDLEAQLLNIPSGDYVQLSLLDTGCGMDELTQEKLFDPFFSTKGDKGTGLGLSQVFGFVKRAGGVINVTSQLNYGSEFVIYFPRYQESGESFDELNEIETSFQGKGSILVVDDEAALRDLASVMLRQNGYEVISAENGRIALSILEKDNFDLMISDIVMPEMDGYELATIVQNKYPEIKIQLVSGYNDESSNKDIDINLQSNLLRKPYESKELLRNIRVLLSSDVANELTTKNKSIKAIEWSDVYSVGIEDIDNDHKKLLLLLNRSITIANNHLSSNELGGILDELIDYTQYHFKREENIMEENGYPQFDKHRKVHELIVREVQHYKIKYDQGELSVEKFLEFLSVWLKDHILGLDKSIGEYIKGKNTGNSHGREEL
ncbi:MAG: hypothetical protein DIZ80_01890 [endosymbiont of Galathealinum brachiosum]|uniref:Sensor protein FixL n=1 Tax=endosymbiont of Galathealinum brachiosum TaxID=2200906 RepID=A0A370DLB6_9GAMM|nr:MAG: hypothetical protein DIZ80_01890 [endosymbiont of Galathealinum brachiosum]